MVVVAVLMAIVALAQPPASVEGAVDLLGLAASVVLAYGCVRGRLAGPVRRRARWRRERQSLTQAGPVRRHIQSMHSGTPSMALG